MDNLLGVCTMYNAYLVIDGMEEVTTSSRTKDTAILSHGISTQQALACNALARIRRGDSKKHQDSRSS